MKTITLDDVAYERLKAWKRGRNESFSTVVKRLIPEPGTLRAFLGYTEANRTDELPGNEILQTAIEGRSATKGDPWI